MKLLADCAAFDHATWADVFAGHAHQDLPAEVQQYLSHRPKACLNFEEADYGAVAISGFVPCTTGIYLPM